MQQINLYLPEYRPNREPLRAIHMLWCGLIFLALLIGVSLYTHRQQEVLQQQLAAEQKNQATMQAQLTILNAKPPAQASAELDVKIIQLQKSVQRHQQILSMIANQNLGNDQGFSQQLNALAQASLSTLAIEHFSLLHGGKYAEISGVVRSADQIPLYLQRLRKDSSFTDVGFGVLTITRDPAQAGLLKFSLAKANNDKSSSLGSAH